MSVDFVREVAMSLPSVTEQIQWEDHLIFKIGGKIFALTTLGPVGVRLSVKSTPEKFAELTEIQGVIPAPYMARNYWVALERWDAIPPREIEELIRESYQLVFEKLPRRDRKGATERVMPRIAAPAAERAAIYGALSAVNLSSSKPLFQQLGDLAATPVAHSAGLAAQVRQLKLGGDGRPGGDEHGDVHPGEPQPQLNRIVLELTRMHCIKTTREIGQDEILPHG